MRQSAAAALFQYSERLSRQTRNFLFRDQEIVGNQRRRIPREPLRYGDLFEHRAIEQREELRGFAAHLFNVMSETLLNKSDVTGSKFFGLGSPMCTKNGDPRTAFDDVLPLVGIRMPMQFAQRARLQVLEH